LPETGIDNPYEPPRSSQVAPEPEEPDDGKWPLVVKLLALSLILECIADVAILKVLVGSDAEIEFGNILLKLVFLYSIFSRNKWGWILTVAWTGIALLGMAYFELTSEFEDTKDSLDWMSGLPVYMWLFFVPWVARMVLMFMPQVRRWLFRKHTRRDLRNTIPIWGLFVLGIGWSLYNSTMREGYKILLEEEVERREEEEEETEMYKEWVREILKERGIEGVDEMTDEELLETAQRLSRRE